MRKKIIIGIILLMIIVIGVFIYMNVNIETEYTPEPEIEDIEYRNTVVSLYFQNKETKELQIETRLIDSKELLKNPHIKLINLILEGPNTESLESTVPQETKLISAVLEGDCLVVNLSKEFIDNHNGGSTGEIMTIYGIVNSLTELKDIDSVEFKIEGEFKSEFKGHLIFNEAFERNEDIIG